MTRMNGMAALITGGGQGVGLGIARAYAREGANLVITGRDQTKLKTVASDLEALGAKVVVCPGDSGVRASAATAVQAAIDAFGRLDVLVNNAQTLLPGVMLEDVTDEHIERVLSSGFYGTLWHMLAALPHMKKTGGSIINLGSREGMLGGPGMAIYGAGKEAIRGLTRTAAREWGQYNIRVNVIAPAAWGPSAEAYFSEHPEATQIYLKDICLGRFGDPETDIGPAAVFLGTKESHYVTGQTLNVDGGQVML